MQRPANTLLHFGQSLSRCALLAVLSISAANAADIEVLHADSLAGPMRALKAAFEAKNSGVTLKLTAGVSRDLAARILKGDACDVFAPSSPAVIDEDLLNKKIAGSDKVAATWYVVFSANEMVVITAKGNPLGIREVSDLAKPQVKLARVTGERDLATSRTLEFVKRATAQEGKPELAQKIVDGAPADPAKPTNVPGTVDAVKDGRANAGIVYYSAAIAARNDVDIVRFPDNVNLSEAIRNAATVPGTARNATEATVFVAFLLTPEAQAILKDTGQPPVIPPIRKGAVPASLN
jgi:molybdate transport system substrate-binding protein